MASSDLQFPCETSSEPPIWGPHRNLRSGPAKRAEMCNDPAKRVPQAETTVQNERGVRRPCKTSGECGGRAGNERGATRDVRRPRLPHLFAAELAQQLVGRGAGRAVAPLGAARCARAGERPTARRLPHLEPACPGRFRRRRGGVPSRGGVMLIDRVEQLFGGPHRRRWHVGGNGVPAWVPRRWSRPSNEAFRRSSTFCWVNANSSWSMNPPNVVRRIPFEYSCAPLARAGADESKGSHLFDSRCIPRAPDDTPPLRISLSCYTLR